MASFPLASKFQESYVTDDLGAHNPEICLAGGK